MSINNTSYSSEGIEQRLRKHGSVFFLGVCGSGMRALAELMADMGYRVLGSDRAMSPSAAEELGARKIEVRDDTEALKDCPVLVYTNAVSEDDVLLKAARDRGLLCISRANMLGYIADKYKRVLAVCGAHGKSTTSAMLYKIMSRARLGTVLQSGARICEAPEKTEGDTGDGRECIVVEACEYMRSFLSIRPHAVIALNLEHEHTDCYPRYEDIERAFLEFLTQPVIDRIILNYDNENLRRIAPRLGKEVCTYSLIDKSCELYAENISYAQGCCTFDAFYHGRLMGRVRTKLPGRYNVENAMASILCALEEGIAFSLICEVLADFCGVERRMQWHFTHRGYDVYEDYAHHPSEIAASLEALREVGYERLVCVFQPHTYSRLNTFFCDMADALRLSDEVLLLDVYSAREVQGDRRGSRELAHELGERCTYVKDAAGAVSLLANTAPCEKRGAIIIMGAGDIGMMVQLMAK